MLGPSTLVLASASPRRREFLERMGLSLAVEPPHVDESLLAGELPADYVLRVAQKKTLAVEGQHPQRVVLAADTCVVLDGVIFGKPIDAADAMRMLLALSGRTHEVLTGVVALGPAGTGQAVVSTQVRFGSISEKAAAWYIATGETMDKAGAYAIQGRGGAFVLAIQGSYSNVVGLPLVETLEILARAGLDLPWR